MQKNLPLIIVGIIVLIALGGFVSYESYKAGNLNSTAVPAPLQAFAQCLKDKGIVFYGAFWCPHCAQEEQNFGMTRQQLADVGLYHECSNPDGQTQNQSCNDAGISAYPTWKFPDGSVLTGVQTIEALADKSQCALPSGYPTAASPEASTTGQATQVQ